MHAAQSQEPLPRAFELERRGSYEAAAEAYRGVLRERPTELAALNGLERSLGALNRLPEMIPQVQAAVAARPRVAGVYGVALRVWSAADRPDSARRAVELWADLQPDDETPFREWANAALGRRDRATARRAYELGRARLRRPDAMAAELAQLALAEEDFATGVREWMQAVRRLPGYRSVAVNSLGGVAEASRGLVLRELERDASPEAMQTAASLRARWGDPVGGFRMLTAALPEGNPQALELLRQLQDIVQPLGSGEASRALGMTLEAMAERSGGQQAARLRLDAARRYAEAGDSESAHRMLELLARDGGAPRGLAADAAATLIAVLLDEGKVAEAAADLHRHRGTLSGDQAMALGRRVALGWARAGDLAGAEAALAGDSTVEGMALRGRFRLFRGDLAGAVELLQAAGPFAGTRAEATERTGLLALLQPIEEDSLPELGAVFLALERADTATALTGLSGLAGRLPAAGGGAELQLLQGRLLRARGDVAGAERAFRAGLESRVPATAPAAAVELGRLLLDTGRPADALPILEQVILDYPASAAVPQARRLLDEARGAVPRT